PERRVPARGRERLRPGSAQQRRGQPLRMSEQRPGGPALLAQPAAVGREVPRVDVPARTDPLPALQGAVRAVGGDSRGYRDRHTPAYATRGCVASAGAGRRYTTYVTTMHTT